jgi:hypothetical protein
MLTSRLLGYFVVTSTPSMKTRPALACSSPAIVRSVVVLPQPEGPSNVTSVPGSISKLTLVTIDIISYRFITD